MSFSLGCKFKLLLLIFLFLVNILKYDSFLTIYIFYHSVPFETLFYIILKCFPSGQVVYFILMLLLFSLTEMLGLLENENINFKSSRGFLLVDAGTILEC